MMQTEFRIRARLGPLYLGEDNIQLFAYQHGAGGSYVAKKLELVEHERNTEFEPFIKLERNEAQVLMDDLWEAGIRPTEGAGSAGAMKAVQNHLEDMKTITFHVLKIQEKQK